MANKTVTVKPAGGDYTTLAGAIVGELVANPNLVTMSGILGIEIGGTWAGADTTAVVVNGFTTNASYYVNIYADSANRAIISSLDTARYQLTHTVDYPIRIQDDFVRVVGLQLKVSVSNFIGCFSLTGLAASNYIQIRNCRLTGVLGKTNYGFNISDADARCDIINCIVDTFGYAGLLLQFGTLIRVFNTVVYNCTSFGIERRAPVVGCSVVNSAIFNTGDDYSGAAALDYCASDDDDGTHNIAESGGGVSWTEDFVAAASGNFTLRAASHLLDVGTTNPSSGLYLDDIAGTTRSAWDIGPFEYIPVNLPVSTILAQEQAAAAAFMRRKKRSI